MLDHGAVRAMNTGGFFQSSFISAHFQVKNMQKKIFENMQPKKMCKK